MDRNRGIWGIIACILIVGLIVTFSTSKYITHQEETERIEMAAAETVEAAAGNSSVFDSGEGAPEMAAADGSMAKSVTEAGPGPGAALEADEELPDEPVPASAPTVTAAVEEDQTVLIEISPLEGSATNPAINQTEQRKYYLERLRDLDARIRKMRSEETDSTTYSMKNAAEKERKLWDHELNIIYGAVLDQMDEEAAQKLVEEERIWMKQRDSDAMEAAKKFSGGTMEGLEYTASLAESTKARAYELVEVYMPETKQ